MAARLRAPGWYRAVAFIVIGFAFCFALSVGIRKAYGYTPTVDWDAILQISMIGVPLFFLVRKLYYNIASKLSDYRLGLFASKDYAQRNGIPQSGEALSQHPIIGYAPDFIYSDELRYLAEIGNKLETSLSSSSINVQHAMLHASCGVGVLPLFIGLRDPDLVRILESSAEITRSFWMVVHQDSRRIARVAAVVDWLKDIVPREVAIH